MDRRHVRPRRRHRRRRAGSTRSTPHDLYDHDDINEIVLLDMPVERPAMRPVLVRPSRNGFMYVMDRAPAQVLSAEPTPT